MLKGIIFDFDGVILESNQSKSDAFYSLYEKYGTEIALKVKNHHEENEGVSRFEKFKFYHKNFLNRKVTPQVINDLSNQFSDIVFEKVCNSPYVFGVRNFIRLASSKYKLFISTLYHL